MRVATREDKLRWLLEARSWPNPLDPEKPFTGVELFKLKCDAHYELCSPHRLYTEPRFLGYSRSGHRVMQTASQTYEVMNRQYTELSAAYAV
jgi:hypothetical protein